MANLPASRQPSDFNRMVCSIATYLDEDGISETALYDTTVLSETAAEFEAGMNAMVELMDIVADYNHRREPDHGTYDEEEELWGTEGDDFEPDDSWFDEGGAFDPDEDD